MKRNPWIFAGGALAAAVCSLWLVKNDALALDEPGGPAVTNQQSLEFPFGKTCFVTIDPVGGPVPVVSGKENLPTGLAATNTLRGTVVHSDAHWIVLSNGDVQNWIARDRVLVIHVPK